MPRQYASHTRRYATALLGAALAGGCLGSPPRFDGPAPVRNQHPAQLTVGQLAPRPARATPAGGVDVAWNNAYSSLFLAGQENGASFEMDGEYLRSALAARVGLGRGVDVEFELPVAHTTRGFLDGFIIGWHDAFGFPDQNRDEAPRDQFGVEGRRDGAVQWQLERSSFELLDVPVAIGVTPWAPEPGRPGPSLTLRAGLELPTGDDARGYGSGELDWMLGAAAEWRFAHLALNAHLQHSVAGTPDQARAAGLDFRDVTAAGVGVELPVHDRFTLLGQLGYETSTLRALDVDRAADDHLLLWTGARWRATERLAVELAIGEDLAGFISPDFTAWLAFRYAFGGPPPAAR